VATAYSPRVTATLRFYFDYESPNAYLAWTQLPQLAAKHGAIVEPVPVLYSALLDAHGQKGPGEIPAKAVWMMKNVTRKALVLGVPLVLPAYLPFNPLWALRVTLAIDEARRTAAIDALFAAVWGRGLHVGEPEVVQRALDEAGLPGARLVEEAQSPAIKLRLREQTADAAKRGVFGVPMIEIDRELFWGYDDLPFVDRFLAGTDPLPRREGEWQLPAAGSVRKQFRS